MSLPDSLLVLEQWPAVRAIATSAWGYPLVSTLHLLGIALLVGGIAPVDLRLLGCWRSEIVAASLDRLRHVAAFGLVLAIVTGCALFSVRASEYIENPWLLAKWGLLALAVVNAGLFGWRRRAGKADLDSRHARLAGGLSMLLWLGALACGRWIAFA
jgi:hypothetical protein